MNVKEILLKNISENKFFDICNFVEEVYLTECDLLILMARKFYNLFCVFHEINCEKYERLGIPYDNKEKKIVTNRALPLLKKDLQCHKFKKVIIVDDIIIHGRSIREVYDEVVELCPEVEVLFMSYVRNDQEKFTCEDIVGKIRSRYQAESNNEWRELSDEIVNIFYMAGRPYISYLPYFQLDIDWNSLKEKLQPNGRQPIQDEDMKKYGVEAFMYTGNELEIFQKLKCCKLSTVRFYHYSKLNKVIAVPYFCLDVMEKDSLKIFSDMVRNLYFTQEYKELAAQNDGANAMRMMELEYTLSAWLCMYVLDVLKIPLGVWHKEIESYNFCETLLPEQELLSGREVQDRLMEIEKISDQVCLSEPILKDDTKALLKECEKLQDIYKANFPRWLRMNSWTGEFLDYIQRFIENYLVVNGRIDEERCKGNNIKQKRLFGIPISCLLDKMSDLLCEIYEDEKKENDYVMQAFAAILKAVDSGKGTIVTKAAGKRNKIRYSESVIYAGEQNYKFYEITNFPVMYGLYLIEQESKRQNASEKVNARKAEMVDKFAEYLELNNIFYIKEEMQQIAQNDISDNYKRFLQNSYEKYYGNPTLDEAVTMALHICNSADK